jgi:hypothetical protein
MAPHGIYLGGERSGRQDGRAPPGRHRQQVRAIGHDEHGPDFGGQVQDHVVLVIRAVVDRPGYPRQQPSPTVLGRLREDERRDVRGFDAKLRRRLPFICNILQLRVGALCVSVFANGPGSEIEQLQAGLHGRWREAAGRVISAYGADFAVVHRGCDPEG